MRILVDQNLAASVAESLTKAGHDAVHTRDIDMRVAPDEDLLDLCRNQSRLMLTSDVRLNKFLADRNAPNPSVIIIRHYRRDIDALSDVLGILSTAERVINNGDHSVISLQKDKLARKRILPFTPLNDELAE